jgi:type I restriction enzyme S subunit
MNKKNVLIPDMRFPDFENEMDWHKEKLVNISEIIMGASPSSSSYNISQIGLPLLQGNADIKNRLSSPRIYTSEITKECEIGDILLSVRAPVGTVAKSLHKACIGRGISALRAIKPNSQEYLYQFLFSYESSWQKVSQGGTFDAVNSDDIKTLLVPIPNPNEQQKIARCLSSLDEVIAAHNQKLNMLKDHKKGLMQNLFPQEKETVPKYRFPEFKKNGTWVMKPLNKVFSIFQGFAFSSEDSTPSGTRWLKIADVGIQQMKDDSASYLPPNYAEKYQKFLVKTGDYVIALTRPILNMRLKLAQVDKTFNNALLNQRVGKIVTSNDNSFVYYILQTVSMVENINKNIAGNEPPNLSFQQIEDIEILLPPKREEQQKIAACLSALDKLIVAEKEKINELNSHKKGLMQGLFPKLNV